jgi:hypothetical protein
VVAGSQAAMPFLLIETDYEILNSKNMAYIPSAVRPTLRGQSDVPISTLKLPNKTSYPSKIMRCDVVFGSPSMDCNGTGICRITSGHVTRTLQLKKSCQLTHGQIEAAPNGKVSIYFFREFLCTKLFRQHFRKGVLSMKEACPIPSKIFKGLDINGESLLPGDYAIFECDGYFRVDMDYA